MKAKPTPELLNATMTFPAEADPAIVYQALVLVNEMLAKEGYPMSLNNRITLYMSDDSFMEWQQARHL
jgi:hypothetical protein